MKKKCVILISLFVSFVLFMLYMDSGIRFFKTYEKEFFIENQTIWHQQFSFKKEPMSSISVKLKGEVDGDLELILGDGEQERKIDIPQRKVNRYTGTSFIYDWYSKDVTVTIKSKKGKIKELRAYFDSFS